MNRQLQKAQRLPSLITGEHRQQPSIEELQAELDAACASLEPLKEYTGNQLYRRNRRTYLTIVKMLGEGLSTRLIAFACGVSPGTIQAVGHREQISIEAEKARILSTVRAGMRVCAERVLELSSSMNAFEASLAFKIFAEKEQMLVGAGEALIIRNDEKFTHTSLNKLLSSLPDESGIVEANVEERQ
jgi:hypothetical protein